MATSEVLWHVASYLGAPGLSFCPSSTCVKAPVTLYPSDKWVQKMDGYICIRLILNDKLLHAHLSALVWKLRELFNIMPAEPSSVSLQIVICYWLSDATQSNKYLHCYATCEIQLAISQGGISPFKTSCIQKQFYFM